MSDDRGPCVRRDVAVCQSRIAESQGPGGQEHEDGETSQLYIRTLDYPHSYYSISLP
jgi:hypothetical protein